MDLKSLILLFHGVQRENWAVEQSDLHKQSALQIASQPGDRVKAVVGGQELGGLSLHEWRMEIQHKNVLLLSSNM